MRDPRDIIRELVDADEAAGAAQMFVLYNPAGRDPIFVGHPGWPEDVAAPTHVEVDDLAERGWVRIDSTEGKGRSFAVTARGRQAGQARARQLSAAAGSAVALDWEAVSPVLDAVYEAYEAAGAPEHGVGSEAVLRDLEDHDGARAALRELVRGGYLEAVDDVDQTDIPVHVRPTPLTMQLLAGWPAGTAEEALDGLVDALNDAIASADGEKRAALVRVRDGLLGAARDVLLAYLERKIGV